MQGKNKYVFVITPKKFFTSNLHRGLGKRLLSLPKRSWISIYERVNEVTFPVLFISFVSVTAINCENHCLKYFHDSSVLPTSSVAYVITHRSVQKSNSDCGFKLSILTGSTACGAASAIVFFQGNICSSWISTLFLLKGHVTVISFSSAFFTVWLFHRHRKLLQSSTWNLFWRAVCKLRTIRTQLNWSLFKNRVSVYSETTS